MTSTKVSNFIERDVNLASLNTLALPGRAAAYAKLTTLEQLALLAGKSVASAWPRRFVLGGGSNLVLCRDFDGLVIHAAIAGREKLAEDADAFYLRAGAGENWHDFVAWTLQQDCPGLENLSLIPGTVGAAPIQNIGAYGLEMAEHFHALSAFDLQSGALRIFDRQACRFGYRDSVFKQEAWFLEGRFVITDVTFRLPKAWRARTNYADIADELSARQVTNPCANDIARAVIAVRQRKLPDPAQLPNVGSFFHNPLLDAHTAAALCAAHPNLPCYPQSDGRVKLAAAWLIEQAGWKGKNLGPAGMYEKQALVLVNRSGARGSDILALMRAVQADVQKSFGVALLPEPVFVE